GGYSNEIGVVSYNWQKLYTGRTNLDAFLTKTLTAKFNMGYVRRSYRAAQQPDPVDQFGNLVWGGPATLNTKWRGWQDAPPEGSAQVDNEQHVGRTTASIELRQNPLKWLTNRVVAGIDAGNAETSMLYPRDPAGSDGWWGTNSLGNKTVSYENNTILTLDYSSSATKQF